MRERTEIMASPTRAQQIFLYIAPFPAFAVFKIWSGMGQGPGSLLTAVSCMLAYCVFIIWLAYRWDRPTYFDWAVVTYFAVATFLLAVRPQTTGRLLTSYIATGIYASLFSAAFFPPLLGMDPFTYHYAKKSAPKAVWEDPIFVTINRIMTYVWTGIFAVCLVLSLYPWVVTRAILPIGLIVGFGVPFNRWFPDYYLGRLGLPSLAEQRKMAKQSRTGERPAPPADLPKTAWEAVSGMPGVFNPDAAADLSAIIGFDVSGSEAFEAYLQIENGSCALHDTSPREPDLLIRTPADVWLAISRGERDGQEAFMKQAFTAEGNLGILMRMNRIFSGKVPDKVDAVSAPQSTNTHPDPERRTQ
jgi:putative sterol carrier protein